MAYSEKIKTHIAAAMHFILAEAESSNPFVTDKEREEAMSNLLIRALPVNRIMALQAMTERSGIARFLRRFTPVFRFGIDSENEDNYPRIFLPPFELCVVAEEQEALYHRLSLLVERELIAKVEKIAVIRKTADKYSEIISGIDLSLMPDDNAQIQECIAELMMSSVILYKGVKLDLRDKSEENQKAVDKLLMRAIYDKYPENVAPDDLDTAMVKIIHATDTERKKIMLSDNIYFEDTFSSRPYCWSRSLIQAAWITALEEEILISEEDEDD